jgi:hypothetical protein
MRRNRFTESEGENLAFAEEMQRAFRIAGLGELLDRALAVGFESLTDAEREEFVEMLRRSAPERLNDDRP